LVIILTKLSGLIPAFKIFQNFFLFLQKNFVMEKKLINTSYSLILIANFLLYFGFYILMPVFPFYLTEMFQIDKTAIGLVLSSYSIAMLVIRPFSGYLLDTLARKPLYICAYFIFMTVFAGYPIAGTLFIFTLLRVVHGLSFGLVSVAGNTIVIDITPSARRGEALGLYGLANNIAMAVGPMMGLILYDYYSFNLIFTIALISCTIGFFISLLIKTPLKKPVKKESVSLDRFILLKGLPVGLVLLSLSLPYGITSTYIAMYAYSIGIEGGIGLFFTFLAVSAAISRLFSGRLVDKGKITEIIIGGMCLICVCFFTLAGCAKFMEWNPVVGKCVFFGLALFMGIGFGSMFPAFNTLFVNLASHNQRATATSTYLVSWDSGVGLGLALGGYIAQVTNFQTAFFLSACLIVITTLFFVVRISPYFHIHKHR
jgi:MFS family permease